MSAGIFFLIAGVIFYLWWMNPDSLEEQSQGAVDPEDYERPRKMSLWSGNSADNELIAYLYLASVMMRVNRLESREKMQFVHRYIARHFKGVGIKPGEYMSEALRYDVDLKSVTDWLKKRMNEERLWKLMEFLIALSLEDGVINELEFNKLISIGSACGLSASGVEERIVRQRKSRERSQQSAPSAPRREDLKTKALTVLGFSELVSLNEIKQRYRSLVKQYHPDSWHASSGLTKTEAENRFLQVQQAYEYLETQVT